MVHPNTTLASLVVHAMTRRETSSRGLAKLAQDHGYKVVGTTLSGITKGTYKSSPSRETIEAIAWLAGVSTEVARGAAGQPTPGPAFADELPPGVDYLTPRKRRVVIDLLRVLIEEDVATVTSQTKGATNAEEVQEPEQGPRGTPSSGTDESGAPIATDGDQPDTVTTSAADQKGEDALLASLATDPFYSPAATEVAHDSATTDG